jgi:phosphate transport system protein
MPAARRSFHRQLEALEQATLHGLELVDEAVARAAEAVQAQDAVQAQRVIEGDDAIDAVYLEVKHGLLAVLATQAPVAGDLRLVAALLDVIRHVERMGDQCVNIAKRVPFGGREPAGGPDALARLVEMSELARELCRQAGHAFAERDVDLATDLARRDLDLNALNRAAFDLAVSEGGEPGSNEWSMQMMLTARWLERVGDYAVDIGEEAAFVATGEFREFTDASHPGGVPRRSAGP